LSVQPKPDKEPPAGATVPPMPRLLSRDQRRRLTLARDAVERADERLTQVMRELVAEGAPVQSIAAELGYTRQGIYKRLREKADHPTPAKEPE